MPTIKIIGYRGNKLFVEYDGVQYILACDQEKVKGTIPNLDELDELRRKEVQLE